MNSDAGLLVLIMLAQAAQPIWPGAKNEKLPSRCGAILAALQQKPLEGASFVEEAKTEGCLDSVDGRVLIEAQVYGADGRPQGSLFAEGEACGDDQFRLMTAEDLKRSSPPKSIVRVTIRPEKKFSAMDFSAFITPFPRPGAPRGMGLCGQASGSVAREGTGWKVQLGHSLRKGKRP